MYNFFFYLGKIFNKSFKNKITLFFYLNTLAIIMLGLFSTDFKTEFIMIEIVISILVITTIRLSNSMIYSKLTKHLSMNIFNLEKYYELDYCEEKDKIADMFKDECVQALLQAKEKKIKIIRATTHKWMVDNVFTSSEILKYYDFKCKKGGNENLVMEITEFIPMSRKNSVRNKNFIRTRYKVKLKLKKEYR